MRVINAALKLKKRLSMQLSTGSGAIPALVFLLFCTSISSMVWWWGPLLSYGQAFPLSSKGSRISLIATIGLVWLFKFLLIDLDIIIPFYRYKDPQVRKNLRLLKKRFLSAIYFLKNTVISKQDKRIHLMHLPWYLLIGPANAGKTTLLAHAKAHFILQRQFRASNRPFLLPTQNCEWWVTKEHTIIDIPGRYLLGSEEESGGIIQAWTMYRVLWAHLLKLMKKQRCSKGVNGILIALPLPEMLLQHDVAYYENLRSRLIQQVQEIQCIFQQQLPCFLIITKCDLVSGFAEFFAECGSDEIMQAWGVLLTPFSKASSTKDKKMHEVFLERCNVLIKRLNQQLLWRLHQEHHDLTRSAIKDFPLQMERLKDFTVDFIKQLSVMPVTLTWQGVYFTSAIQPSPEMETVISADGTLHTSQVTMPLLPVPPLISRAYFIKHLITQVIVQRPFMGNAHVLSTGQKWCRRVLYTGIMGLFGVASAMIGMDFKQGMHKLHKIQTPLARYQTTVHLFTHTQDRFRQIVLLLNALHPMPEPSAHSGVWKIQNANIFSFYTRQSDQVVQTIYNEVLQMVLIPELKNVLEHDLEKMNDKKIGVIYATLKAYLMLGNMTRFQAEYVMATIHPLLSQWHVEYLSVLEEHLMWALVHDQHPMSLNASLIESVRNFLNAKSDLALGIAILNHLIEIDPGPVLNIQPSVHYPLILTAPSSYRIPARFTADQFRMIMNHKIVAAAKAVVMGNGVLGQEHTFNDNPELESILVAQLRSYYAKQYAEYWKNLIAHIQLSQPSTLAQTDKFIVRLISNTSPLLKLLQMIHDHIHFAPVLSVYPTLQRMDVVMPVQASSDHLLYPLFSSLQALHEQLQKMRVEPDLGKGALDCVIKRVQENPVFDALAQLRFIAEKNPLPIHNWLLSIANAVRNHLTQEAAHYLDRLWKQQVIEVYSDSIVHHYPFNMSATQEVDLQKWIHFMGEKGSFMHFYQQYLQPLIDPSQRVWRWKTIDGLRLPLSSHVLQQIQYAVSLHQMFFPLEPIFAAKKVHRGWMVANAELVHCMDLWGMGDRIGVNPKHLDLGMSSLSVHDVLLIKKLYHPFTVLDLQNFSLTQQLAQSSH